MPDPGPVPQNTSTAADHIGVSLSWGLYPDGTPSKPNATIGYYIDGQGPFQFVMLDRNKYGFGRGKGYDAFDDTYYDSGNDDDELEEYKGPLEGAMQQMPQPITYPSGGQLALIGGGILNKLFSIGKNIVGKVYNGAKKLLS